MSERRKIYIFWGGGDWRIFLKKCGGNRLDLVQPDTYLNEVHNEILEVLFSMRFYNLNLPCGSWPPLSGFPIGTGMIHIVGDTEMV